MRRRLLEVVGVAPVILPRKQPLVKHWEGETIVVDIKRKVPPGDRLYEWYGK